MATVTSLEFSNSDGYFIVTIQYDSWWRRKPKVISYIIFRERLNKPLGMDKYFSDDILRQIYLKFDALWKK